MKIFNFNEFKQKKDIQSNLAQGRKPLYVSHLNGTITGSDNPPITEDFGQRLQRIKDSLEKINALMKYMKETK